MITLNKKQILVVGNDGVQLYVTNGRHTTLYADYSNTGGTLSTVLATAFKRNNAPLTLMFDVVEQQYRKETIPKINFLDKKKVIQRKLAMAFPQQQMRAFLPSKQKPKEGDSMVALFAAMSPNLTVVQIMDAVLSSEVTVTGNMLLPVESTTLLTKMKASLHTQAKTPNRSRWAVLMTLHKTGGLRQIVTKDDELALTRLTPLAIDPYDTNALVDEMEREFAATLAYLSRLGYVQGDGLDMIIVSSETACQRFRQHAMPVTHLYPVTPVEAGRLAGLKLSQDPQEAVFSDILHAGWSGVQRKSLMPLSSPLMDKITEARRIAQGLIFILVLALGYAGWQVFVQQGNISMYENEILDINMRKATLQSEHDELAKKLNTLKYDPERTRVALETYDKIAGKTLHVEPLLEKIVKSIDKSSMILQEIQVETMDPVVDPVAAAATGEMPKMQMTVTMKVGFVSNTSVESAALQTNALKDKLRQIFPDHDVTIDTMVGNLALDKTVQGISEQIAANEVDGRLVKEGQSVFKITGAAE